MPIQAGSCPSFRRHGGSIVEGSGGLLATWKLDGTVNQQDFFNRMVAPAFAAGSKRVFVVISDAFRYEAAEELVRDLNGKSGVKAALDAMLGVLPSYTALGMASLLPHASLAYKANANLDVTADGMPDGDPGPALSNPRSLRRRRHQA
jgi:hypothetical protein